MVLQSMAIYGKELQPALDAKMVFSNGGDMNERLVLSIYLERDRKRNYEDV